MLSADDRRCLAAVEAADLPFADFWRLVGPAHETQHAVRSLVRRGLMLRDVRLVYKITPAGKKALHET